MDCEYGTFIGLVIAAVAHKKLQEWPINQGQDFNLAKTFDIGIQYEISQSQLILIQGTNK